MTNEADGEVEAVLATAERRLLERRIRWMDWDGSE